LVVYASKIPFQENKKNANELNIVSIIAKTLGNF